MSAIEVDHHGNIAVLCLNEPETRNALNIALCRELEATLQTLQGNNATRAIIVSGNGRAFCAGANLTELQDAGEDGLRAIYLGFLALYRCPLPTIAAVNGAAVGAGMNLALAADIRTVSEHARFDSRFLDLGIHPGGGHTWLLQRLVGVEQAACMVLLSDVVTGGDAVARGLASRLFEHGQLIENTIELVQRCAGHDDELQRATKKTMRETAALTSHDAAVERELETQVWSMQRKTFDESVTATQASIQSTQQ